MHHGLGAALCSGSILKQPWVVEAMLGSGCSAERHDRALVHGKISQGMDGRSIARGSWHGGIVARAASAETPPDSEMSDFK